MFNRDAEDLTDSVKAAYEKKNRSSTSMAEKSSAEQKDDAKLRS